MLSNCHILLQAELKFPWLTTHAQDRFKCKKEKQKQKKKEIKTVQSQ